jgi:predicted O-methyltransferase YrrM
MEHFYHNLGEDWFTYPGLYSAVVSKYSSGKFVEIGSWKGRSASYLAVEIHNSGKPIELICVDTWKGSVEHEDMDCIKNDTLFNEFLTNTAPVSHIIKPLRFPSLEAAKEFEDNSLNFVFIDASHEYEDVKQDIAAWYSKVAPGGVFAGHDFMWPGVYQAVTEWATANNMHLLNTSENCWLVYK